MARVEKTVFICYRRTNLPWALAIFQYLTAHGYDVFFDYTSINSGDFEQIILANIKARAHFLVVLTPSALERCDNPGDWLRREIETALDTKRNIVPLMLEGFDFGSPSIAKYLADNLANLKRYNALNVPADYFEEAMDRLCTRFLNVPLDAVLHPVSNTVGRAVKKQQAAAAGAAQVETKQLSAQEWFEKGYNASDPDEKIHCYREAIRLKPDYADAYYNRGVALRKKGDLDDALKDYSEAIRLKPDADDAYRERGIAFYDKGDFDNAAADYTEAIRLKPDCVDAYTWRGIILYSKGDFDGAVEDYSEVIRLKPDSALAHYNRGSARKAKGDLDGALKDYSEAIRLKADYANAYYNRGLVWEEKEDYYTAMADFQACINASDQKGDKEAEKGIQRLQKKLGR